jgi:dihydrofolate synthase / folylpolyglutamate synthase
VRYSDAIAALDRRTNYERSGRLVAPTLERISELLELMDHPEQGFPAIHVTGTNGKTTCAIAATELLRATGLRVATYTSPHVVNVRERIAYDGSPISEDDFVEVWREVSPYLDLFDEKGMPITWFEAATAMAFAWFADKAVDAAVIEVGMGGSWDATNVVDAPVAAIASIDVDHPELGSTPAEVAGEKAGIIKRDAIACSLRQSVEVDEVLRARAREMSAEVRVEGDAFALERAALALGGTSMTIRLGDQTYSDVFLPMFGEQFARDATLGAAAAHALIGERSLHPELVADAFGRMSVPGRMEVVRRRPLVVLDGAHNPSSAAALAKALADSFQWDRLWVVVSIMDDKDVPGVLAPIVARADEIIVTSNESPRAASTERLSAEVRALGKDPIKVANVSDAISVAFERAEEPDCILVTGSLYTVGEARRKLVTA